MDFFFDYLFKFILQLTLKFVTVFRHKKLTSNR